MITEKIEREIVSEEDLIKKSMMLIHSLFADIVDKSNKPYVNHLKRVGNTFTNMERKVIGYMHDVVEDTTVSRKELIHLGFPDSIVESILLVSKKEKESYDDFINRIIMSNNINAMLVKRSDLKDNMNIKRIRHPKEQDYERLEKYRKAYEKIEEAIKEKRKYVRH